MNIQYWIIFQNIQIFEYLWVYKQAARVPVRPLQTGQRWTWGAERNLPPWYGTLIMLLLVVVMVVLLLLWLLLVLLLVMLLCCCSWWWCCDDGGQDVAPWYPWFVCVKMSLCRFVMKKNMGFASFRATLNQLGTIARTAACTSMYTQIVFIFSQVQVQVHIHK